MIKTNKHNPFKYRKKLFNSDVSIFTVCFFLGVAIGTACIRIYGTEESFVNNSFASETWFGCFYYCAKYLILVFLLAFTAFGRVAIPFVFIINGYSLSKSVSSGIALSGVDGLLSSVIYHGIDAAVLLPLLLVLSKAAIDVSNMIFSFIFVRNKTIKINHHKSGKFIIIFCISLASLLLLSFLDAAISSILVDSISNPL